MRKTYKEYIQKRCEEWIGKTVIYTDGISYKVVDVDYNGAILINRPADFTDTTAIEGWKIQNGIYIG